jgi:hypothetical protein
MLKVQLKDSQVIVETVPWQGRSFEVRYQNGWMELPSGERRKVRVSLDRGQSGYSTGEYAISDESIEVDDRGNVQMARNLKLDKLPVAVEKLGAALK